MCNSTIMRNSTYDYDMRKYGDVIVLQDAPKNWSFWSQRRYYNTINIHILFRGSCKLSQWCKQNFDGISSPRHQLYPHQQIIIIPYCSSKGQVSKRKFLHLNFIMTFKEVWAKWQHLPTFILKKGCQILTTPTRLKGCKISLDNKYSQKIELNH